jgi:hypothetical protein
MGAQDGGEADELHGEGGLGCEIGAVAGAEEGFRKGVEVVGREDWGRFHVREDGRNVG